LDKTPAVSYILFHNLEFIASDNTQLPKLGLSFKRIERSRRARHNLWLVIGFVLGCKRLRV
jgi:hypothetical protein